MNSAKLQRATRRIVLTLLLDRSLTAGAAIALHTVIAIVATDMTGNASWAGVPAAVYQLAAAITALGWGLLWDRTGRRVGVSLAMLVGFVGAATAAASVELGSVALLLAGIVLIGGTQSGITLARFVASEVSPPDARGRAIAMVVWGGTIGAIGGPLVVSPASRAALSLGFNELTGPIAVGIPVLGLGVLLSFYGLRPEPTDISRQIDARYPATTQASGTVRPFSQLIRLPGVIVAVTTVLLAQTVMVMLMGITSLYMKQLDHSLGQISLVFAAHTLGMFAFSPISGRLSDQLGRGRVLIAGSLITILAAIIAPISPSIPVIVVGLFLLGLGWNLSFVAGSALLADQLSPAERSKTQGANDLLVGLASGTGSLSSGLVFAALGYGTVSLVGGILMSVGLALSVWWVSRGPRGLRAASAD
jgi:MFS family permease